MCPILMKPNTILKVGLITLRKCYQLIDHTLYWSSFSVFISYLITIYSYDCYSWHINYSFLCISGKYEYLTQHNNAIYNGFQAIVEINWILISSLGAGEVWRCNKITEIWKEKM